MSEKILSYNLNIMKQQSLAQLCDELGIELVNVSPDDSDSAIGYIAGIEGIPPLSVNKDAVSDVTVGEMIVFSGITSERLDVFLAAYRERGLARIPLKATITPHNIRWSARQLYSEISEEHEMMSR